MNAISRRACTLGLLWLFALSAGCANRLPPATDAGVAREALVAALDAWKDGKPIEGLRSRTPPVDFRDSNWESGFRLIRYQIQSEQRNGQSASFTVQLFLQKDGASRERTVAYTADAGKSVVIRPEFGTSP